jgi:NifB/MoaA-like Fe-S oxidoreductase
MSQEQPPGPDQYDGYPQLENGVGLMASFLDEVLDALDKDKYFETEDKTISIATGTAAYGFMKKITEKAGEKFKKVKFNVFSIENEFFGKNITVAGLLTARDMIKTLKEEELGDVLMIPCVMLKSDEDIFLDDVTVGEFSEELGVRVEPVYISGYDFIDKIAGRYENG